MNHLKTAKRVISEEVLALGKLAENIPSDFEKLAEYILQIKGRVILSGMGKSGHIAKKIASSLASTGTAAFYIHPGEASHGDLGMITEYDMVIVLSTSGETKELFDMMNYCKRYNIKLAAMTMKASSTIGKNSDFLMTIPDLPEASVISAPTTSSLMMLALGDALVVALHEAKGFTKDDFLIFHPGGKIGSNLLKVSKLMHSGDDMPLVRMDTDLDMVVKVMSQKKLGCALIADNAGKLVGILTDGDLRRNFSTSGLTHKTVVDLMTKSPLTIDGDKLASEALYLMNSKSISILPVIEMGQAIGVIHIYDILKAGVA